MSSGDMPPVRGQRALRGHCVLRDVPPVRSHRVLTGQPTPEGSLCPEIQSFLEGPFQSLRDRMVSHQEEMKSYLLHRVVIKPPVLLVAMMQREGPCACSGREVLQ